jgi:hypothetical protein
MIYRQKQDIDILSGRQRKEVVPHEAPVEAYSATGFPVLGEKAFWTG